MATRSPSSQMTSAKDNRPDQTDTAQSANEQAQALAETVSDKGGTYAEDAKQSAISRAGVAKNNVAAESDSIANTLRTAAQRVASEPHVGADYRRHRRYVGRNPAVFLGAAALTGLAAVRFAKASKAGTGPAGDTGYGASRSHDVRETTSGGASSAGRGGSAAPIDNGGLV